MLSRLPSRFLPAFALLLAACQQPVVTTHLPRTRVPGSVVGARLRVVATFSILGDLVQNVGGDRIELRTLVGPDGDSHTFEPATGDGSALFEASLIFENGLELEPWLDDLYASSGSEALRVVVTQDVEPRLAAGGESRGANNQEPFDPHVWHDVAQVMRMVEAIRDALATADPANRDAYRSNADAYLARLQELDRWIFDQTESLPEDRRKLVTSHDTFSYFAARYNFEIVGTALGAASTEAADPSAAEIAALVDEIKAAGVPAIFAENVNNPRLMEQIAREAGVALGPTLYTDALSQTGTAGDTYVGLIRHNVTVIVAALRADG